MPLKLHNKEDNLKRPEAVHTPGLLKVPKRGNKIHFVSLGCPRNLVDTEVMLGILLKSGYEVTDEVPLADYLLVNTCGFLEVSRQESVDTVAALNQQKKKNARLIVTGCMVQSHKEVLQKAVPEVDYYLGSGDVEGVLRAVQSTETGEEVTTSRSYLEAGEVPRQLSTPKHYAYLKIAEGCRKRCAYCIIPVIKGPLKSKPEERILKEFDTLLNQGVKEIILIAQDLGDYGKDRQTRNKSELYALLKTLLSDPRPFWLRLLYLYPDEITDELLELMKSDKRLLPYLDMPIQHINDEMLKRMRRTTDKEQILKTITRLRKEVPEVVIRTSLIVGFPGETEEEFQELKKFIVENPLDNVGIFRFSKEEGSAAYDMENQIPEDIKEKRYHELMQTQERVLKKWNKRWIGKEIEVVVEGYHPETNLLMRGRHYGQCPEIDGMVIINDGRAVKAFGEVYTVKITDVAGYDLVGAVVRN